MYKFLALLYIMSTTLYELDATKDVYCLCKIESMHGSSWVLDATISACNVAHGRYSWAGCALPLWLTKSFNAHCRAFGPQYTAGVCKLKPRFHETKEPPVYRNPPLQNGWF